MQQEESGRMPWAKLASGFLLTFAGVAPTFCVPPMEYILKEELLLTHTQTSLLFTSPIIMMVALAIPGGILADRIGIRKAAGIGAILAAVGAALRGSATDFSTLLAFTFVFGTGWGLVLPNMPKVVSMWVPRERVGLGTGVYTSAMGVSAALAVAITLPLIFPITNTFQGTFLIWSIPAIVAAPVWWVVFREPYHSGGQDEPARGGNIEFHHLLKSKSLWLVGILYFLNILFFDNWVVWTPALIMAKGAPPDLAALIASLTLWVGIPTALLAPRLSDKLGLRKPFLLIPCIIMAFASWWAIYANVPMGWPIMALAGMSHHAILVITLVLPVELLPREVVGRASGLMLSVGNAGGIVGPLIGGYALDLTGSLQPSLLVLVGVSIAAAITASQIPETGPRANIRK